jgi:hypothetical protein
MHHNFTLRPLNFLVNISFSSGLQAVDSSPNKIMPWRLSEFKTTQGVIFEDDLNIYKRQNIKYPF